MIVLKLIGPETAFIFKDVRLRALQDSPLAFSSTYAKESRLSDEEWLRRSERWSGDGSVGYLAFDLTETACGMVACYAEDEDVPRGHVIAMWVDPAWRRAGVGRALIDGLSAWARQRGLAGLKLMVTSVNDDAIRFYERLGFVRTGNTGPYPNDPLIIEYEMILALQRTP